MKIKFVPQDCWIGLYWKPGYRLWDFSEMTVQVYYTFYLCLIPCFPLIWRVETTKKIDDELKTVWVMDQS